MITDQNDEAMRVFYANRLQQTLFVNAQQANLCEEQANALSEKTDPDDFTDYADDLNANQWRRDNQEAIAGYNADVDKNGVFGDSWRGQIEVAFRQFS